MTGTAGAVADTLVLEEPGAGRRVVRVVATRRADGWGVRVAGAGLASGEAHDPVELELSTLAEQTSVLTPPLSGYVKRQTP